MTRLNAANNAETTLTQAVGISDTTIEVYDASKLPDVPFMMSIEDEIIKVTAVNGNVLTVERAMENTDAGIYDVGTTAECRFTAGMYDRLVSDDELRKVDDKVDAHSADYMPHQFTDSGKTYRWGFRTLNGQPQFIYEEVIE